MFNPQYTNIVSWVYYVWHTADCFLKTNKWKRLWKDNQVIREHRILRTLVPILNRKASWAREHFERSTLQTVLSGYITGDNGTLQPDLNHLGAPKALWYEKVLYSFLQSIAFPFVWSKFGALYQISIPLPSSPTHTHLEFMPIPTLGCLPIIHGITWLNWPKILDIDELWRFMPAFIVPTSTILALRGSSEHGS